jgi:hypothetical protein
MKLGIDLTVDHAFKKVFGDEINPPVLINLLHAVVQPAQPVTGVEIMPVQSEKTVEAQEAATAGHVALAEACRALEEAQKTVEAL